MYPQHNFLDYFSLVVSTLALMFIALTMFLRGNDYRKKFIRNRIAMTRIFGFTLAGFAPWGIVPWWVLTGMYPSIFVTIFLVGIACVFFTTENLPPWWEWLTKGNYSHPSREVQNVNAE
jgi:hypothetical protein